MKSPPALNWQNTLVVWVAPPNGHRRRELARTERQKNVPSYV